MADDDAPGAASHSPYVLIHNVMHVLAADDLHRRRRAITTTHESIPGDSL